MSDNDPLLDRAAIEDAFRRLGAHLARRGVVVGGSVLRAPAVRKAAAGR